MPTSPAPRSTKKTLGGSASDSNIATSAHVSPPRSTKKKLNQELLELEHDDGKRHSKELTLCLNEYAKKIEELHEKNRLLEEELSFDDHVARDDPFYNEQTAEKLSNLYLQGNNFMIRLELERKEVARLNTLIQSQESVLAQQKTKLYELAALDHNHAIMLGRIRKMEHDVDRRLVKMNEKLNRNRKLRETIDAHRTERARMDEVYTKISTETMSKRHKLVRITEEVEKLREEVKAVEQEIVDVRQQGEEWEMKCDRRAAVLLQELKEIATHQKDAEELVDVERYKFLGENDIMRNMSEAKENVLQSRAKRSRWKTGQTKVATDVVLTKYQENRTYIEKIHEVSEHFDRIQHVNQLAEEIEYHRQVSTKLREEIGKLKQRKDSVDFQRMNRIEGLRSKLQYTNEQKKLKEDANREMHKFLEAIKPAVLLFHSRIGCSEIHSDGDMKVVLGDIEEQIVTILQSYHAKVEAATKEENVPEESIVSTKISPQTSPSKRKASVAVRSRRSSVVARASVDRTNESETARAGSVVVATSSPAPPSGISPAKSADQGVPAVNTGGDATKSPVTKSAKEMLSKQQPYRYVGLRPPHMSMEELRKKDNVEEEYPLTYHELKTKVWQNDTSQ
ncbi:E3 ubiquitin-protein ligase mib1 [Phytophthora boehmeriae]|uniref:E3 ubiquitin-protein ligase mib1 n=1 Tax=Phytophthora boehmeriae TaxID=109152 RepID=A0A8T1X3N5_9STRA|nr:E3 ubiquitin-protein ligase mib1 [Phytophthora boehmeriae]